MDKLNIENSKEPVSYITDSMRKFKPTFSKEQKLVIEKNKEIRNHFQKNMMRGTGSRGTGLLLHR